MGKKRRILTRTTKFAKKYFEFLDKVDASSNVIDSTEVDDLIEVGDTFIDSISVVDNENETVTVTGRVLGGGHTTGNVEVSVNGGAFGTATATSRDAGAGGLGEVTYSITTGVLGKGTHTVRVRKASETNEALHSEKKSIKVRENRISIQAGAFTNHNASNQIKFAKADLFAADPGAKKAGQTGAGNTAALSRNGINIVVAKDGGANTATLLANGFDDGQNGTISAAELNSLAASVDILASAATGTYTFTVTPLDSDGNALADSAITFDVTVE